MCGESLTLPIFFLYNVDMKRKFIDAYMKTAEVFAELSSARRLHVGAIIVKDNRIISIGYNGMPSGWDNDCEIEVPEQIDADTRTITPPKMLTRPEVLHAETNCIAKLARSTESGDGATMFTTHAPCLDCAKLIYQSGIRTVYYKQEYRNNDGLDFLRKCDVHIINVVN